MKDNHYDAFGRRTNIKSRLEHYIRPKDGRLEPLVVQVNSVSGKDKVSWRRTYISTKGSVLTKILFWVWSGDDGSEICKYPIGCLLMLFLVCHSRGIPNRNPLTREVYIPNRHRREDQTQRMVRPSPGPRPLLFVIVKEQIRRQY